MMEKLYVKVSYNISADMEKAEFFELSEAGACQPIDFQEIKSVFPNAEAGDFYKNFNSNEIPVTASLDEKVLYSCLNGYKMPSVVYFSKEKLNFFPQSLFTFFSEYPFFAQALAAGNYVKAANILAYSESLFENQALIKYILKEKALLLLCFFWMFEFNRDKDEELSFVLKAFSGGGIDIKSVSCSGAPYVRLMRYAIQYFSAETLSEFKNTVRTVITSLIYDDKQPAVIPIVGTGFTNTVNYIIGKAKMIDDEITKSLFLEEEKAHQALERLHNYFKSFKIFFLPEPNNIYDINALLVIIEMPGGERKKAGYVKKEFAAVLTPLILKGVKFDTSLYTLTDKQIEIKLNAIP